MTVPGQLERNRPASRPAVGRAAALLACWAVTTWFPASWSPGVAAGVFSTAGAAGNKKASQGCKAGASCFRNEVRAGLEAA